MRPRWAVSFVMLLVTLAVLTMAVMVTFMVGTYFPGGR